MQVPRPHASFPHGDTIPFAVSLLTNEQGQPWDAARDEGVGFELYGGIGHQPETSLSLGQSLDFSPVTGSPGRFLAEWRPPYYYPRGLYHYHVTLERRDPQNGYGVLARYTLLRGSLTLT